MRDLWKYRWYSLALFYIPFAVIMLSENPSVVFASVIAWAYTLLFMVLIMYTHERTLLSKVALGFCSFCCIGITIGYSMVILSL